MTDSPTAGRKLKALRERTTLSHQDMADALGMPKSTYASKEDKSKKAFFDPDFVRQVGAIFEREGISPNETWRDLAGIILASDLGAKPAPSQPKWQKAGTIPEVDIRAGMGGGGIAMAHNHTDEHGNTFEVDDIRGLWCLPPDYLRHELRITPERARIVEVQGDSMEPTLRPGDRVMIDTAQRSPSPGGLFGLWDGFGVVVKRLELIPNSEPPSVQLISDNDRHSAYERTADEVNIIGRVVWVARRV